MCAGTLVHIPRHLGKTSNNNKRYQLCIHCMLCRVCCHRVYFRFPVLWLLCYSCLHPALPLVFYSTSLLLLSYYSMSIPYLISLAIYLLALVCLCSWHGFQCMFMIQIYRYTCAYLCTPFGISITARWRILTPLDPHVQVSEIGAYGFS